MSVRKLAVAVAVAAFMASGSVFAQATAPAAAPAQQAAAEEADEDEAVEEEVAAPAPAAPVLAAAPVVETPAPVAEAKPAAKPETKVDFYGSASYRFRGRMWSASSPEYNVDVKKTTKTTKPGTDWYGRGDEVKTDPVIEFKDGKKGFEDGTVVQPKETEVKEANDGSSFDYLNLLGWSFGAKVKVDDKLSLQFQIGNDLNAGESVRWNSNNMPSARESFNNLYVHLAYAAWNQGSFTLTGGVIPVSSNGTLDLLERSLSTGSYGDAVFQTWSTQLTNSLVGLKLGVPIVKEGVKVSAELTTSIIEPRTQSLISGIGTTGAAGVDPETGIPDTVKSNPTSALLILDIPIAAGDFKITPQITTVLNRNYNSKLQKGDIEFLGGLSAGYKLSDAISLSVNGAYGTVGNENSLVGAYGSNVRSGTNEEVAAFSRDSVTLSYKAAVKDGYTEDTIKADTKTVNYKTSYANAYVSTGLIAGVGATVKAGPGVIAFNVSYGNSFNAAKTYFDTTRTITSTTGSRKFKYVAGQVGTGEFVPDDPNDPDGDQHEIMKDVVRDSTIAIKSGSDITAAKEIDPKALTNKSDIVFDLRYTWNVHPKFSVMPRWRTYVTTYDEGSKHVKMKMENRPEIILTGSF